MTKRELQIAEMYAEGYGNLEIANQLDIKQNTVSTIKKNIFDKLKIENLVELIDLIKHITKYRISIFPTHLYNTSINNRYISTFYRYISMPFIRDFTSGYRFFVTAKFTN